MALSASPCSTITTTGTATDANAKFVLADLVLTNQSASSLLSVAGICDASSCTYVSPASPGNNFQNVTCAAAATPTLIRLE